MRVRESKKAKKTLFIIAGREQAKRAARILKKMSAEGKKKAAILALNFQARETFQKLKIHHLTPDDYFPKRDYKHLDREASGLIKSWLKEKAGDGVTGEEILTYRRIPLWELVVRKITYFHTIELMRQFFVIRLAIEKEKPWRVIVVDNRFIPPFIMETPYSNPDIEFNNLPAKMAKAIAGKKGVKVKTYHPGPRDEINYVFIKYYRIVAVGFLRRWRKLERRIEARLSHFSFKKRTGTSSQRLSNLIFCSSGSQVEAIAPIVKQNGKSSFLVLRRDNLFEESAKRALKQFDIPYRNFEIYLNDMDKHRAIKMSGQISRRWKKFYKSAEFNRIVQYEGVPLLPVFKGVFAFLCQKLRELIEEIEGFYRVLEKEGPSVVVTLGDELEAEKALVCLANIYGVPTLSLQHGVIANPYSLLPLVSEKIALWGPSSKELLVKYGIPLSRLIVTGAPRYDFLFDKNGDKKRVSINIKPRIGLKEGESFIILATEPYRLMENAKVIELLRKILSRIDNLRLVVKVHPAGSLRTYRKLIRRNKWDDVIVIKNVPSYDLINASEMVITVYSTRAVEAIILDKPVIVFNMFDRASTIPFVSTGAAIGVRRREELGRVIKDVMRNKKLYQNLSKNRGEFINKYLYLADGRSSKRVIDLIEVLGR
jgi:UDP-N-acetylglucosamine 2-epimerase